MDTRIEMLAHARHDDLERRAARRRLDAVVGRCRRKLLGIFPISRASRPCDAGA